MTAPERHRNILPRVDLLGPEHAADRKIFGQIARFKNRRVLQQCGITRNRRGVLDADAAWQTEAEGVFVAGDMHRGASLIVWAIAEGRSAAAAIHDYLGARGDLPAPVRSSAQPLGV